MLQVSGTSRAFIVNCVKIKFDVYRTIAFIVRFEKFFHTTECNKVLEVFLKNQVCKSIESIPEKRSILTFAAQGISIYDQTMFCSRPTYC